MLEPLSALACLIKVRDLELLFSERPQGYLLHLVGRSYHNDPGKMLRFKHSLLQTNEHVLETIGRVHRGQVGAVIVRVWPLKLID